MTGPRIASHETEIRGRWIMVGGRVEADDDCRRIDELVAHKLRELGQDATGWDRLFVDPGDGRHWELTYPESELHGGGPPRLRYLQESEARAKYGHLKL
jgi:hypothetical protein